MSRAAEHPSESPVLVNNPAMTFRDGRYTYTLSKGTFHVTDGASELALPVLWAFGHGTAGQTYIVRDARGFIESRVSYYHALGGLALTVGTVKEPRTLEEALGRRLNAREAEECIACHTTGLAPGKPIEPAALRSGVQCDACHAGAARHAAAAQAGDAANARIASLKNRDAETVVQLCGRCHRTGEQVFTLGPLKEYETIRFQPYRLMLSRCYDSADRRIGCTGCHDPHQPVVRPTASYDANCKSCHPVNGRGKGRPCPKSRAACVSCHMPVVEFRNGHRTFIDHYIRVTGKRRG